MNWLKSIPLLRSLSSKSASKRRRSLLIVLAVPVLVVLLVLIFSPHLIGKWRSQHLTSKAIAFEKSGDYQAACSMAESAYLLDTTNLEALRLATNANARLNLNKAALLSTLLFDHEGATLEDQRRVVKLFYFSGNGSLALRYAKRALEKYPEDADLKIVLAQSEFLAGDKTTALALMRDAAKTKPNSHSTLALAEMLIVDKEPSARIEGQRLLFQVLKEDKSLTAEALKLLSRAPIDPSLQASIPDLADMIPGDSADSTPQTLNALTLAIRKDPSRRAELIQTGITQSKDKDLDALLVWLRLVNASDEVLKLTNPKDAQTSFSRYRSYLSALLRTGKLKEAEDFLKNRHPGLPPVQALAIQAKLAEVRGAKQDSVVFWSKALDEAQTDDSGQTLLLLGELAVNSNNAGVAVRAFTAAYERRVGAQIEPKRIERLMGIASQLKFESELTRLSKILHDRDPSNPEYTNNYAYFSVLQKNRVPESIKELKDLVEIFPDKITYRTSLALAYLRAGSPKAALQLFAESPTDWTGIPESDRIIYIATLKATGNPDQAKALMAGLNLKRLLPSERELVDKL